MPAPARHPARRRPLLLAAVAAALATVAAPAVAVAQPETAAETGFVRLAHLSPDGPPIDAYLQSADDPSDTIVVPGQAYGAVSDYRPIEVGSYVVAMRPAGAPPSEPPVISATMTVEAGEAYTVAGLGARDALGITVLDDELDPPPPGSANVRVINAAVTAPALDVVVDGSEPLVTGLPFAEPTRYQAVPAGTWTLRAGPAGATDTPLPVDLAPNAVYTVLLVDNGGGLAAQLFVDARGAVDVPAGAVEAGFGGAAGLGSAGPAIVAAGLGTAAVAATGLVLALRRPGAGPAHRR